jgi:hypothetical protein
MTMLLPKARPIFQWLGCLVLCQFIAFAWFWQVWYSQEQSFLNGGWDTTYQTFSWMSYNFEALKSGTLPLWDFRSSSGNSHVGEMQPGALYPLIWLFAQFAEPGNPRYVNALIVLHFGIAMQTMLFLLRAQGLRLVPAMVGAVLFAFSGSVAIRANAQANLFFGLAWMPLFVQGYLQCRQQPALAGIAPGRKQLWGALSLMAIALGLMILAGHVHALIVVLLAAIGTEAWLARRQLWARKFFAAELLTLRMLLVAGAFAGILALPQLYASAEYLRYALKWYGELFTSFPHHVPLAAKVSFSLALSDFLSYGSAHATLSSAEVLSLYMTRVGAAFALIGLFAPAQQFRMLRNVFMIGGIVCLVIALLARTPFGFLLQLPMISLLRSPARALHGLHLFTCGLAAIGIARALEWAELTQLPNRFLGIFNNLKVRKALIALGGACLLWLSGHELWQLKAYGVSVNQTALITPQLSTLNAPLLNKIKSLEASDGALYRFTMEPIDLYSPNAGLVLGIRHTRGYRSSMAKDYFNYLGRNWHPDSDVYDVLGARYLISESDYPKLALLAQDGAKKLYLRSSAKPVLTRNDGVPMQGMQAHWGINTVRFELPQSVSGTLRFAQSYFPGWRYRVNNTGPWLAANKDGDKFLQATVSQARTLEFAYRPYLLYGLMAIAALAWSGLLLGLFVPAIGGFVLGNLARLRLLTGSEA